MAWTDLFRGRVMLLLLMSSLVIIAQFHERIAVERKPVAITYARMALRPVCLAPGGNLSFGHGFLGLGQSWAGLVRSSTVGRIFCCPVRIADNGDGVFNSQGSAGSN